MIAPFTKLRGVTLDELPAAIAALSAEDREHLEAGYLDLAGGAVLDHLDPLGIAGDPDAVVLLCTLYRILLPDSEV